MHSIFTRVPITMFPQFSRTRVGNASTESITHEVTEGEFPVHSIVCVLKQYSALKQLLYVPDATYDAQREQGCMENTRIGVLTNLDDWSQDLGAPPIYWMAAMAGIGKTSIALSFCRRLAARGLLGGSFFCSRTGSASRSDVARIIPTLARLLALQDEVFRAALLAQLKEDPDVAHKSIDTQIEILLRRPLDIHARSDRCTRVVVLVIDALDECSSKEATSDMLHSLIRSIPSLSIKVFITSRPEHHILGSPLADAARNRVFKLHEVESSIVDADIRLYLRSRLRELSNLGSNWFQEEDIDTLTRLSKGLFIFASTAMKYISSGNAASRLRSLTKVVSQAAPSKLAVAPLDEMYTTILSETFTPGKTLEDHELHFLRRLLSSLLVMRIPLSICALAELLDTRVNELRGILDHLHAVIYVPKNSNSLGLATLHASFGDFLTNRAPNHMRIALSEGHDELLGGCFHRMSQDLHINASRTPSSYFPHLGADVASTHISHSLQYACLNWVYHIASTFARSSLATDIENIFCPKFLFWLEVVAALGHTYEASGLFLRVMALVGLALSRGFLF